MRKMNKRFIFNIACYVAIFFEMGVISYIATTKYMGYTVQHTVLVMKTVIPAVIISIFFQISEYYIVLKILKEKVYFKDLHNQVVQILAVKAVVSVVIQLALLGYSDIREFVSSIVNFLYYVVVICAIKKYNDLSLKKTLLFTAILAIIWGLIKMLK